MSIKNIYARSGLNIIPSIPNSIHKIKNGEILIQQTIARKEQLS